MIFRFASLQCVSILAAVTLMAGPSSQVRPSSTNTSQKIIFSSPDNSQINSNLTSTTGSPLSGLQNRLQLFQDSSPVSFDTPSLSAAPPPMPAPMRKAQKSSDDRQQWEFMTPAEILGITPDQSLRTQKGNANNDDDTSLTPLERSIQQRNPSTRFQIGSFYNSTRARNFWGNHMAQTNSMSGFFNNSLNGAQPNVSGQDTFNDNSFGNANSGWAKIFGMPSPPQAQNPVREQQQDMKQFMELLNRGSAPEIEAAATPNTAFPVADSTQPLFNPIGSSFTPLSSGIARPTGVAPLPTITRQAIDQTVGPPAWAPQQPPWLSTTPQPFVIPQRKF